jgi:cytochrome c
VQTSSSSASPATLSVPVRKTKSALNLMGLEDQKAGTVPNYAYSDANKNSGIVWNEPNFKEYIKDPTAKVPGTKKTLSGLKNGQQANDLWAFLKQFDASGNKK